jgi:hypothetical protein
MSNPVVTYHGVQIYLAESEWPACKELVIVAHARGGLRQMLPGIVLDGKDLASLVVLLTGDVPRKMPEVSPFRDGNFAAWKRKVVREMCEQNDVKVGWLTDRRRTNLPSVRRVRAQAVRVLVGFMSYEEAGRCVGITDHGSVHYWIKGKGKDKYK